MANPLPYFRWFPADAQTDQNYSAMTDAELGFFHRCLNQSWINNGIPEDLNELARTMRVKRSYLDKIWTRVGMRFEPSTNYPGKLVNPRQESERCYATTKSERASASVRTRYERSSSESTNVLPRAQARPDSASDSSSVSSVVLPDAHATPIVAPRANPPLVPRFGPNFERVVGAFLAAGVMLSEPQILLAAQEWAQLAETDHVPAAEAAENRAKHNEARFMGLPNSWLRKREWAAKGPGRVIAAPPGKREVAHEQACRMFRAGLEKK